MKEILYSIKTNTNDLQNIAHTFLLNQMDINIKDNEGMTLLHHAVKNQNLSLIKLLLAFNANVNEKNNNGNTPLMYAAWSDNRNIIKLLKQNNAKVDIIDKSGGTALDYAIEGESTTALETLIEEYFIFNENTTPLIYSINKKLPPKVVLMLIENCKNIDFVDDDGHTALLYAIAMGYDKYILDSIIIKSKKIDEYLMLVYGERFYRQPFIYPN